MAVQSGVQLTIPTTKVNVQGTSSEILPPTGVNMTVRYRNAVAKSLTNSCQFVHRATSRPGVTIALQPTLQFKYTYIILLCYAVVNRD